MIDREVNAFLQYLKSPYRLDHPDINKEQIPTRTFSLKKGESRLLEVGEGENRLYIIVKHHKNGEYSIAGK